MYPTPQEQRVLEEAEKVMGDAMAKYDPSHDKYHVQRVRKTALSLARAVNPTPDLLIVELAALLHDVLDKKYVSPEQAADPYAFFLPLFIRMRVEHGVDLIADRRGQTIARVIENVSWSTEKKLREKGEWTEWHETPLHTPPDDPEHAHSAIQHFHDKLLAIRDRLKTAPGKKMGDRRHQVVSTSAPVSAACTCSESYLRADMGAPNFPSPWTLLRRTNERTNGVSRDTIGQLLDFLASVDEELDGVI
ncbi:hypothetical protein NLJ89_g2086 [Agrocybe chaxingu]|uniref:HD/PDEase domain-containing protein n=1 Tax=Agrocybe chaxingu TaxID=84603 RepID=A0A9W8KBI1_9AGAR|nr:hypothetical protein NLJ89_g2086 [Agrocybe chaxingu]